MQEEVITEEVAEEAIIKILIHAPPHQAEVAEEDHHTGQVPSLRQAIMQAACPEGLPGAIILLPLRALAIWEALEPQDRSQSHGHEYHEWFAVWLYDSLQSCE